MALFDAYIIVDWSARSTPGPVRPVKDALWIGEGWPGTEHPQTLQQQETYWRTRSSCLAYLQKRLLWYVGQQYRILLGCDFAYGYPAGLATALQMPVNATPWHQIWQWLSRHIQDDTKNNNNRFTIAAMLNTRCAGQQDGPFWGRPAGSSHTIPVYSPGYPFQTSTDISLQRLRLTESMHRGIQPTWKLYGIGSVGSQTLLGIPALHTMRTHPLMHSISRVWPFETGFTPQPAPSSGPWIVHAEIWPGLIAHRQGTTPTLIRDQWQVHTLIEWLKELDDSEKLRQFFATPIGLTTDQIVQCQHEEGWILGTQYRSEKSKLNKND